MSENPIQAILKTFDSFAHGVQAHLSHLFSASPNDLQTSSSSSIRSRVPKPLKTPDESAILQSAEDVSGPASLAKKKSVTPLTKEELGRATWTLLHSIAAQFPDQPTRQQKRDAKELMAILSRLYPCKECADHFKEVLKANPVQAGSQAEFSQWLCHVHNVVNRSLGKSTFPSERLNARWGKLDCEDRGCDVEGS
ncbi:FAD-linked sulfhydryl oxidase ERV1-like isoform X1 [Phoenix dactylifera]|uniref:Sulfhydryl oxidase n=1 Tax=Phoenix dactylifera TaxID=42345 RepID=A0A8B7BX44_PHODC|nr:FAD-linked sulfhydryl oxidase ERV1-like isoform X1 [Phoenix dactylifera]